MQNKKNALYSKTVNGTIIAGQNNFFTVECGDGTTRECSIKGKKIKTEKEYYNPLAPGDSVEVEADALSEKKGQIVSLCKRRNVFLRWNIKGQKPQLLAANLDFLVLVTTPDEPPFRPRFIDRALIQAEEQGITPVIVINKSDLAQAKDAAFLSRTALWQSLGYRLLYVSAKSGLGLAELAALLGGRRSAFIGQSGVGKSSLINRLGNGIVLKTGSLSKKYGRGAHTTTKGTLFHLTLNEAWTGGRGIQADIIDTPGIRRFILDGIAAEDIILYFREMKEFFGQCRFGASCTHTGEPGCKVLEAVQSGKITGDRFESYRNITEEIRTGNWKD